MNHNLQFRAWHKKERRWITIHQIELDSSGAVHSLIEVQDNLILHHNIHFVEIDTSTAFEDDCHQTIFFGDIVQFAFHDEKSGEEYSGSATIADGISGECALWFDVSKDEDCFAVDDGGQMEAYFEDHDLWDIKIIGNIHENGYLLYSSPPTQ